MGNEESLGPHRRARQRARNMQKHCRMHVLPVPRGRQTFRRCVVDGLVKVNPKRSKKKIRERRLQRSVLVQESGRKEVPKPFRKVGLPGRQTTGDPISYEAAFPRLPASRFPCSSFQGSSSSCRWEEGRGALAIDPQFFFPQSNACSVPRIQP
jgi:hypothetical protein